MLNRVRRRSSIFAIAVVCLLGGAVTALASPLSAPILRSPGLGKSVHAGKITLVVKDPGVPNNVSPVYVTISSKRKLDKYGHLIINVAKCNRCDFTSMHHWKGHPGLWIVTSKFSFAGYWAVTPGKYYWQAQHVAPLCQAPGCEVVSAIHSFRVVP
jgi:hypothetical protein